MATFTQDKKITKDELKAALKIFLPFSVQKIGENLLEVVITVSIVGLTLAYIGITQPLLASLVGGHIIFIFMLILLLRVVQDFDDHMTVDELAERLEITEERIEEIHRIEKNNVIGNEDEFNERLINS